MPSRVLCPICSSVFVHTDEVWTTFCGHLFHRHCLDESLAMSNHCPQCRSPNPEKQRLYLDFDMALPGQLEIDELTRELVKDQTTMAQLRLQLETSDGKFLDLQALFNQKDEEVRKLAEKVDGLMAAKASRECIQQMMDETKAQLLLSIAATTALQQKLYESERKFVDLQTAISRNLGAVRECQERAQARETVALIKRDELAAQIRRKTAEKEEIIRNLTQEIENMKHGEVMQNLLEERKLLEDKLERTSHELDKEVQYNTKLIVDKVKLQTLVTQFTEGLATGEQVAAVVASSQFAGVMSPDAPQSFHRGATSNNTDHLPPSVAVIGCTNADTNLLAICMVQKLIKAMGITFSKSEFPQSYWKDKQLIVTFRSEKLRLRFWANKERLLLDGDLKNIKMTAFKGATGDSLFDYAQLLRSAGYAFVWKHNGTVHARKANCRKEMVISKREQVDAILKAYRKKPTGAKSRAAEAAVMAPAPTPEANTESDTESEASLSEMNDLLEGFKEFLALKKYLQR